MDEENIDLGLTGLVEELEEMVKNAPKVLLRIMDNIRNDKKWSDDDVADVSFMLGPEEVVELNKLFDNYKERLVSKNTILSELKEMYLKLIDDYKKRMD